MKLAISDEVERTTADARPVIRSSDEAWLVAGFTLGSSRNARACKKYRFTTPYTEQARGRHR
jgi:hypothetical protein